MKRLYRLIASLFRRRSQYERWKLNLDLAKQRMVEQQRKEKTYADAMNKMQAYMLRHPKTFIK